MFRKRVEGGDTMVHWRVACPGCGTTNISLYGPSITLDTPISCHCGWKGEGAECWKRYDQGHWDFPSTGHWISVTESTGQPGTLLLRMDGSDGQPSEPKGQNLPVHLL